MTELNLNPNQAPVSVEPRIEGKPRSRGKRTTVALLLSLLIPGLGQLYNRQPRKGLWMALTIPLLNFLAGETRILLSFLGLVTFGIISTGWRLFIVGDAAHVAWTAKKTEAPFRNPRIAVSVIAGIILLAPFLLTPEHFLHRYTYLRAFITHSDSMCPTVCQGERLIADMDAFKTKAPQRGDVIILQYQSPEQTWTKRIIGVGGDTVEPGPKGTILVNGKTLRTPEICGKPIPQGNTEEEPLSFASVRVPEGSFFVVGDNLDRSFDSRIPEFGFVTLDRVRGKALFLYWSRGRSRIGCPVR